MAALSTVLRPWPPPGRREGPRSPRLAHRQACVHRASPDGARQPIGDPLVAFSGNVHGVYAWIGYPDEEPPQRDPAGVWYLNLTTGKTGGPDDLLDLYGVPLRTAATNLSQPRRLAG
jgi:hypothetical protein